MLNMDFSKAITINTNVMDWLPSPASGVWRKPLAREDAERGHASSIVKYDPGASFSGHDHPLGEEILVLEGIFSDATGDFPAGSYFRNPEGFRHAPFSQEGCVILVKLHQFQQDDAARICIQTKDAHWQQSENSRINFLPLHKHHDEQVQLIDWQAREPLTLPNHDLGTEIYILSGQLKDESGSYGAGTWLRLPPGTKYTPYVEEDTRLWLKTGHFS